MEKTVQTIDVSRAAESLAGMVADWYGDAPLPNARITAHAIAQRLARFAVPEDGWTDAQHNAAIEALAGHKWLDPECGANGCQSLVWKARYEAAVNGRREFRQAYRNVKAKLCDCERGHNGIGMAGRECDCPAGEGR